MQKSNIDIHISYARYSGKYFTKIHKALYGDPIFGVPFKGTNLAARNPEKHLSFSFSSAWENS